MPLSPSAAASVDLRVESVEEVLGRVERGLGTVLDRASLVRKRRSLGARSGRGTWVRVERRGVERIGGQGWNGVECAAVLEGIAKPEWYAGLAWREDDGAAMWRADETELVAAPPVRPGGRLTEDPGLGEAWWGTLNRSLDALAGARTNRVATPDTVPVTRESVAGAIRTAFPEAGIDLVLEEWTPAHADLNWANLTAPECWLLDWEDWGMAPRGLDAAKLWGSSLAVPGLAQRVLRERRADLESRSGKLMALFFCAKVLPYADPRDPLAGPARREADRLLAELQAPR
ncbi:hypothetical protein RM780_16040 [Streptomyces sp. DSM 44917]|uniref:Aminoglycoside phosphotransferase n=1 Tax=Streptomyces boetiae TaxID=3075541 RepID=A0ABU2LA61_9ACTN|nr:hypothetical protein [Streptomyces sp. DSM 44917]MDT0308461.1 hypothetical protein [Streptomyces sp. DSM 44917]